MEPTWVSGVVANIRKVQAIIRWDSWEQDGFDGLFFSFFVYTDNGHGQSAINGGPVDDQLREKTTCSPVCGLIRSSRGDLRQDV